MQANIADAIANFVREAESDLDLRFESQAETLIETHCTRPVIGKWIDRNDVETMLAALDLEDTDFAQRFPTLAHLTSSHRRRFIATIESHFHHCTHCSLKRSYDLELDLRIERSYHQNTHALLHLLENDSSETEEGEHHFAKAAAHHTCKG